MSVQKPLFSDLSHKITYLHSNMAAWYIWTKGGDRIFYEQLLNGCLSGKIRFQVMLKTRFIGNILKAHLHFTLQKYRFYFVKKTCC